MASILIPGTGWLVDPDDPVEPFDIPVEKILNSVLPMASYAELRAYRLNATGVRFTAEGIAGFMQRDDADTTSADDGNNVIVDAKGRRWKRIGGVDLAAVNASITALQNGLTSTNNTVATNATTAANATADALTTALAAANAALTAANNALATALAQGFVTGDFKFHIGTSAPTGWIAVNAASSIGNAGSGATRANPDTYALFVKWWSEFGDATVPLLTSVGGATTRGASALADWNALKRMTVFNLADRYVRGSGTYAVGLLQAQAVPAHTHDIAAAGLTGTGKAAFAYTVNGSDQGSGVTLNTGTGIGGTENRPPTFVALPCVKL